VPNGPYERESSVKVTLLRYTDDPEMTVALASRLCYSPVGIAALEGRWTRDEAARLIGKIMKLGHFSVLEHAGFTFGIEGISRAASHQLVRHRIASYSQQSQRYVKAKEKFEYVLPDSIGENAVLKKKFTRQMSSAGRLYEEFVAAGVPAEDARFLLPNAAATKIVVTMNARALRHFFTLRCCLRAQWEIRAVAEEMLGLVRRTAPLLFEDAGPGCLRGRCPEKTMTCGRVKEVRQAYRRWPSEAARPGMSSVPITGEGSGGA
jgi:thymidylate synthase (FAD)